MPDLFGKKLRALRRQARITQTILAQEIGLAPSNAHISKVEKSEDAPSLTLAIRIARYFGVAMDYLLRDTIPVFPIPERLSSHINRGTTTLLPFGAQLRKLRTQHELTQRELAQRVGLAQGYLSKLEAGSKLPSLSLVVQLADVFEVSADDLLQGTFLEEGGVERG